jgi:hypothetical protein
MDSCPLSYPGGAKFAFTILDDTDDMTAENGQPIYQLLNKNGIKITKTVWAFDTLPENQGPYFAGETLTSPVYLEWIHDISNQGFEIAFHNAAMGSSLRQDTIKALDFLEEEFGAPIRLHCNHGQNLENLHWGPQRYSSHLLRGLLDGLRWLQSVPKYEGNKSISPYYWSDIADQRLSYIRAFTFYKLNCSQIAPGRPYINRTKQREVKFFNTADAPDVNAFNALVNKDSLDRLCREGGWCVLSTHLGKGFCRRGTVNAEFKETIEYLGTLPGYFVPVSKLLDYVGEQRGRKPMSRLENIRMEYGHIIDRIECRLRDFSSKRK